MTKKQYLNKRERLSKIIENHPITRKRMKKSGFSMEPLKGKRPRQLLQDALQDPTTAELLGKIKTVTGYRMKARDLVSRHLKGVQIHQNEKDALIKDGENIETEYREMIRQAATFFKHHPLYETYLPAFSTRPEIKEMFENFQAFVTDEEKEIVEEYGLDLPAFSEELSGFFKKNQNRILSGLTLENFRASMDNLERVAGGLEFPEAPKYLAKDGVIILGGEWWKTLLSVGVAILVTVSTGNVALGVLAGAATYGLLEGAEAILTEVRATGRQTVKLHFKTLTTPILPLNTQFDSIATLFDGVDLTVERTSDEDLSHLTHLTSISSGECAYAEEFWGYIHWWHDVSNEMDELYEHRNGVGDNDLTIYFINDIFGKIAGCAAHPSGQPGAVIDRNAPQWVLSHEVGHVLGLKHVDNNKRLMNPDTRWMELPPDITSDEGDTMRAHKYSV